MSASPGSRAVGYLSALGAGALWGTTGPLSTALYAAGAELTGIGFWRIAVATVGFLALGVVQQDLFRVDRRSLVVAGLGGGAFVALFEVSYQYAIAGAGVAGAAALLYTAPVIVVLLGHSLLGEKLTPVSLLLAAVVTTGAVVTVRGGSVGLAAGPGPGLAAGVAGGLVAAASYAGTILLARVMVPKLGSLRFLVLEIAGGTLILGLLLPVIGRAPGAPPGAAAWIYVSVLALGTVVAANLLFFAGVRRIQAAPTAVAATIEPAVGALLALALFGQHLTPGGWLGLAMVVGGVAAGYAREARSAPATPL